MLLLKVTLAISAVGFVDDSERKMLRSLLATKTNGMGNDLFVDAAESVSFPLPGRYWQEGGRREKMQPLHHFSSHLGTGAIRSDIFASPKTVSRYPIVTALTSHPTCAALRTSFD